MLDSLNLGVDARHALELPRIAGNHNHLLWFPLDVSLSLHVVLLDFDQLPDRVVQLHHIVPAPFLRQMVCRRAKLINFLLGAVRTHYQIVRVGRRPA